MIQERVLISGGTGLVGRQLCRSLQGKGYHVAILSRNDQRKSAFQTYHWDVDRYEIDYDAIASADYIIHLAGAKIDEKRWTKKRRQIILDSRIKTGQLIFEKVKENNRRIKAFISASAIGYYGTGTSDKIYTETDPHSGDFLGEICNQWEQTADKFEELGVRTVKVRTGVVLSSDGGVLQKLMVLIRMGIGSAIGKGNQYIPWIHLEDLCGIYLKAIDDKKMKGAYNAVAPDHKTNKEFISTLAHMMKKPIRLPNIPAFLLKIRFGKLSAIFLEGSRISSGRIMKAGYTFRFPDIRSALTDLLFNK